MAVVERESLADQVAEVIISLISRRDFKPGDSLPSAAQLAEKFAVSRTLARKATADLTRRGIVQQAQGRESILSTLGHEYPGSC